MSVPLWASELARTFWQEAGEEETFPRDLRRPIAQALPFSVVLLPRLRVTTVVDWLQRCGIAKQLRCADRPLRACLVARLGHGIAFLDGADPEDEQRFSLAHELAHYLRDYWQPRRTVIQRLGAKTLAVLDGQRDASTSESLGALLCRTPLGFHAHLMSRNDDGSLHVGIAERERGADRLALELLAPIDHVLQTVQHLGANARRQDLERLLQKEYGLPRQQAAQLVAELRGRTSRFDPLLARLKAHP